MLAVFGLAASLWVSLALRPYSSQAAKHIYLQHLVTHGASGTASTWHLSTTDAVTPAVALRGLKGVSWGPAQPQAWQVQSDLVKAMFRAFNVCSSLESILTLYAFSPYGITKALNTLDSQILHVARRGCPVLRTSLRLVAC